VLFSATNKTKGVNTGVGVPTLQILGWGWVVGLHEILLYLTMNRNMGREHFTKWSLFRNRKICLYQIQILGIIPSILCYVPQSVERLGATTPSFQNRTRHPHCPSFQTRLTPLKIRVTPRRCSNNCDSQIYQVLCSRAKRTLDSLR